jgi:hypothetical protein
MKHVIPYQPRCLNYNAMIATFWKIETRRSMHTQWLMSRAEECALISSAATHLLRDN